MGEAYSLVLVAEVALEHLDQVEEEVEDHAYKVMVYTTPYRDWRSS